MQPRFVVLLLLAACSTDPVSNTQPDAAPTEVSDVSCSSLEARVESLAVGDERPGCSSLGEMCRFGSECCCGECHPSFECECTEDGWVCSFTDACFLPECDAHPSASATGVQSTTTLSVDTATGIDSATGVDTLPKPEDAGPDSAVVTSASYDSADLTATDVNSTSSDTTTEPGTRCNDYDEYYPPQVNESCAEVGETCRLGKECCCGGCFPSTVCTCTLEGWQCYATDACFFPFCPDSGANMSGTASDPGTSTSGAWDSEAPDASLQ